MVKYMVVFSEQVSHESALVQIRFLLVCVSTVTEDNFTVEKFCGSRLLDMQIFNSQNQYAPKLIINVQECRCNNVVMMMGHLPPDALHLLIGEIKHYRWEIFVVSCQILVLCCPFLKLWPLYS